MKLCESRCQYIRNRVKNKKRVLFDVDKTGAGFQNFSAPCRWESYEDIYLGNNFYANLVMNSNLSTLLCRLEIMVQNSGGRVYYKHKDALTLRVMMLW